MTTPILLVAGFLGAGKTTLVNELLRDPEGRRIAALVNDFGAIDIDGELLASASDGVVSLRNGCICCSLQGDLMRALARLIRRDPRPDAIVIETSGAADPVEIVRALLDPVVYAVTPLDTVVTLVDARHLADRPALFEDVLWRSQVAAADFCVLAKIDLLEDDELGRVRAGLARHKGANRTFDGGRGLVPASLFLAGAGHPRAVAARAPRVAAAEERFETVSWTSAAPVSLAAFQAVIGRLAPRLLRAKGFVSFDHDPGRSMLFQLVGSRATLVSADMPAKDGVPVRLVLIAEAGRLDLMDATRLLDGTVQPRAGKPQ